MASQKLFVARSAESQGKFTRGLQEGAVKAFNSSVIPFLREMGVNVTGNINDYTGLEEGDYFKLFLMARVARCKSEVEKELVRVNIREDWKNFLKTHDVPRAFIHINDETMEYVSFNHQTGVFDIDVERYEAQSDIYATTADEKETLSRLKKIIEALNLLDLSLYDIRLLFRFEDGVTSLNEEIYPERWRSLVRRSSKKF